jgi:hypothetical protein
MDPSACLCASSARMLCCVGMLCFWCCTLLIFPGGWLVFSCCSPKLGMGWLSTGCLLPAMLKVWRRGGMMVLTQLLLLGPVWSQSGCPLLHVLLD